MKVLEINSVCGIRGTGRICVGIAEVLENHGHRCLIAYGRERVPEKYKKYALRVGNGFGVRLAALSARLFDNAGFANRYATKKLIKDIESYKPDVIHLHNIHGYYVNIEMLTEYIKSAKIPTVVTLHDCWLFTGHCAYFDSVNCSKWCDDEGCRECQLKGTYPKSVFADGSKQNFSRKKAAFSELCNITFVTPSKWLAQLAENSFLGRYPFKVIYNGVDLSVFKPTFGTFRKDNRLEDKKIVLGVASTWETRKGLADFIELARLLDESYKVVLVGLNKRQMADLPENIIGIARTDGVEKLAELYSEATVMFNPTYEDNFPTVNLEALACGTPVVTYPTGGSPEAIDETCGVVTAERTPESALEAIRLAESMGSEACINRAAQFDMRDKYTEYVYLYEEIAKRENTDNN